MKLLITKVIGKKNYRFEVEGESLFDVVMESQQLSFNDVYKCGLCESDSLSLRAYITDKDKYEYVKVQCGKCRASLTFGKSKKDGAFFLRKNDDGQFDWQKFESKEGKTEDEEWK